MSETPSASPRITRDQLHDMLLPGWKGSAESAERFLALVDAYTAQSRAGAADMVVEKLTLPKVGPDGVCPVCRHDKHAIIEITLDHVKSHLLTRLGPDYTPEGILGLLGLALPECARCAEADRLVASVFAAQEVADAAEVEEPAQETDEDEDDPAPLDCGPEEMISYETGPDTNPANLPISVLADMPPNMAVLQAGDTFGLLDLRDGAAVRVFRIDMATHTLVEEFPGAGPRTRFEVHEIPAVQAVLEAGPPLFTKEQLDDFLHGRTTFVPERESLAAQRPEPLGYRGGVPDAYPGDDAEPKRCRACGLLLPRAAYTRDRSLREGRRSDCRKCTNEIKRGERPIPRT